MESDGLDELRAAEYGHLDRDGHIYLDYAGAGLAAASQVRAHENRLRAAVFGNPHSENPTSEASTVMVESARRAVLRYLNASPDEYAVVFTPNATGACRLVGEAYPFGRRSRLVMTADNHNSVNGLREFARRRGARTVSVPVRPPDLRVADAALAEADDGVVVVGRQDEPRVAVEPVRLAHQPAGSGRVRREDHGVLAGRGVQMPQHGSARRLDEGGGRRRRRVLRVRVAEDGGP